MIFKKTDPKNEIEGIDRAMEILTDRLEKKLITLDEFNKKSVQFLKRKEKYIKKLKKQN